MEVIKLKDLCTTEEIGKIMTLFRNAPEYLEKEFILLTIEDIMHLSTRRIFNVRFAEELLRELLSRFVIKTTQE